MTFLHETFTAIIIALIVAGITDAIVLIVARYLTLKRFTIEKIQRFESGNPPLSIPKYVLIMQYIPFLFLFMACEPIVVLLLLFAVSIRFTIIQYLTTLGIALLLTLPMIYVIYKLGVEIAYRPEKKASR